METKDLIKAEGDSIQLTRHLALASEYLPGEARRDALINHAREDVRRLAAAFGLLPAAMLEAA